MKILKLKRGLYVSAAVLFSFVLIVASFFGFRRNTLSASAAEVPANNLSVASMTAKVVYSSVGGLSPVTLTPQKVLNGISYVSSMRSVPLSWANNSSWYAISITWFVTFEEEFDYDLSLFHIYNYDVSPDLFAYFRIVDGSGSFVDCKWVEGDGCYILQPIGMTNVSCKGLEFSYGDGSTRITDFSRPMPFFLFQTFDYSTLDGYQEGYDKGYQDGLSEAIPTVQYGIFYRSTVSGAFSYLGSNGNAYSESYSGDPDYFYGGISMQPIFDAHYKSSKGDNARSYSVDLKFAESFNYSLQNPFVVNVGSLYNPRFLLSDGTLVPLKVVSNYSEGSDAEIVYNYLTFSEEGKSSQADVVGFLQ